MIPVEIVVTFVLAYLVFTGVMAKAKLRAALAKIATLETENNDLREALLRGDKAGPGWTSKAG